MSGQVTAFDEPVDPQLSCRHCGRAIVATARIHQPIELNGFSVYRWLHKATGTGPCPPPDDPPNSEPYDTAEATRRVQKVLRARSMAHDAYWDALDGERWAES